MQRCGYIKNLAAVVHLLTPDIAPPSAMGQVHRPRLDSRAEDRCDEKIRSEHELIVHGDGAWIITMVKPERSNGRNSSRGGEFQSAVQVRAQLFAQVQ